MGQSEVQIDRASPVWAAIFKAMRRGATLEEGRAAALAVLTPDAMAALGAPGNADRKMLISNFATPWLRYFLTYDPTPNLRSITVPMLAMNGSLDRQVPSKVNLAAIRAALQHNSGATIVEPPGLNHLFRTAKTGALGECATIEERVAQLSSSAWPLDQCPLSSEVAVTKSTIELRGEAQPTSILPASPVHKA
jgi:fermentation-respiration switch protein FrsA (DUF1100 family)